MPCPVTNVQLETFTTDELRALNVLYVENILVLLLKNQNTRQIAITIRNIIIKHV